MKYILIDESGEEELNEVDARNLSERHVTYVCDECSSDDQMVLHLLGGQ